MRPARTQFAFASVLGFIALAQQTGVVFRATTQLVIVDVFARDKSGKDLANLRKEDFTIIEDGKPQPISVFEFQQLDAAATPAPKEPAAKEAARAQGITTRAPGEIQYRNSRLLVLFFDMSSMQPAEQIRAGDAALKFIREQMTPADLVAIMALSSKLTVEQDFTSDRDQLIEALKALRIGEGSELAAAATTGAEDEADSGAAFEADESEFNIFNTDRKLGALESAAKMLAALPEKKALIYFSSGVGKTGLENQSQLRSTINAAVRANISFYPVDARGLVAGVPGGDASQAAPRGSGIFSGESQRRQASRFQDQQETLTSLAADTGGKPFLDSNNLSLGIVQAQRDIRSYYILGYYSTNPALDGKFRRVRVQLTHPMEAKLDYRSGYFAPKEFGKFTEFDKEQHLEEALALGDPVTDLPVALEVNYFRLTPSRYFVPVAVKVPGSEIVLARKRSGETAELDFIGQVRDAKGKVAATVRDGIQVKLTEADAAQLARRNLQYDTGFTLAPGSYSIKFLARENQNGKIGTFETRFEVPDLSASGSRLRTSSVVLAAQREPLKAAVGGASGDRKLASMNPLIDGERKLVPSITRVFRKDQSLFVYLEVYDAARENGADSPASVFTVLSFYRGRTKAFESTPVRVTQPAPRRASVLPVRFEVPLDKLAPGRYTCQLTVIDEIGKRFAFPRAAVVLLPTPAGEGREQRESPKSTSNTR